MCFKHCRDSFGDKVREMQHFFFFFVRPGYQKTKAAELEPVRPYSDNLVGTKAEPKQY